MAERCLRIEVVADHDSPFTVMFEPTGMTYDLAGAQRMFAEVEELVIDEIVIVNIAGGISITASGPVQTRDGDGKILQQLN
jgi:hypothetical protein